MSYIDIYRVVAKIFDGFFKARKLNGRRQKEAPHLVRVRGFFIGGHGWSVPLAIG